MRHVHEYEYDCVCRPRSSNQVRQQYLAQLGMSAMPLAALKTGAAEEGGGQVVNICGHVDMCVVL